MLLTVPGCQAGVLSSEPEVQTRWGDRPAEGAFCPPPYESSYSIRSILAAFSLVQFLLRTGEGGDFLGRWFSWGDQSGLVQIETVSLIFITFYRCD